MDDIYNVHVPGRVTLALLDVIRERTAVSFSRLFFISSGLHCICLKKVAMPPKDNNGVVIAVTVEKRSLLPGYSR